MLWPILICLCDDNTIITFKLVAAPRGGGTGDCLRDAVVA